MNKINELWESIKLLPVTVTKLIQRYHERSAEQRNEIERLDRIRHPEKYRGK